MAKIDLFTGKLPKRIDDYVIYKLGDDWVIRENSGFTTEGLLTSAIYANCQKNSSEFGRVSKACKGLRMALEGILPKKNNLSIVNSLTKHMRSLLTFDTKHVRGERKLGTALANSEVLELFKGYNFNPHTSIEASQAIVDGRLEVRNVMLPEGVSWVGFRLHVLNYDWEAFAGTLFSGGWHFEQEVKDVISFRLPAVDTIGGNLIYLLEVQGFDEEDGGFVPVGVEDKGVFVVDYLPSELHSDAARDCRSVSLSRSVGLETTRNDSASGARGWDEILKRVQDDSEHRITTTRGLYLLPLFSIRSLRIALDLTG